MSTLADKIKRNKTVFNQWDPFFTPEVIVLHVTGRLAQLVERRTREHNVSGLYRCGFESPAGQLKLLIVFRMRR